jgi:hypothetical protein
MLTGMGATMVIVGMPMRKMNHRKQMMDQHRMWRTEGIVLESVMIGQYISDLENMMRVKQMQWRAMYLK